MGLPPSVAVANAAWNLELPEERWLLQVAEAAAVELDVGLGVHGFVLDLESKDGPVRTPVLAGGTEGWRERWKRDWWERVVRQHPAAAHLAATAAGTFALASRTNATVLKSMGVWQEYAQRLTAAGYFPSSYPVARPSSPEGAPSKLYPETLYVGGLDTPGHAAVLCVNLPEVPGRNLSRAQSARWTRAAAHLGAAMRLRRALVGRKLLDGAEAVLSPSGKVEHAEGEAKDQGVRDGLREAAVAMDRARTAGRRATELERLEQWRALQLGRWSLVDVFERDGRRFVVAQPNAPKPRGPGTGRLTLRERQVLDFLAAGHSNKLIAYELGVSASSVSTLIQRAADRLGVASTAELIQWVRRAPPG